MIVPPLTCHRARGWLACLQAMEGGLGATLVLVNRYEVGFIYFFKPCL
jgi:hypothetical protein